VKGAREDSVLQEGNAMGLRIQTNTPAITAQRNLLASSEANNASLEKLSSGYRINKASDDAAGLAVSEKLKADIRGLNMAKRNANDGISLVQTAEGGLNEVGNILVRLRELAVQASSDTIGDKERGFLNKEFGQLKSEITRISKTTEFNGTRLLLGDSPAEESLRTGGNSFPLEIQVGKDYNQETDSIDKPVAVNTIRIDLRDIDASVGETGLNIGETEEDGASVQNKLQAQQSMEKLDTALTKVSGYRATIGAIQSRLQSTVNNLSIQTENFSAANSRVRDTDFAEETAKMTQSQILKQSGIAVLSQSNQIPQAALRLLG
jgi:flagellin